VRAFPVDSGILSGRFLCALCLLLCAVGPGFPAASPLPPPGGTKTDPNEDVAAVHLVIDTLAVDGKGTRLVDTDEADLVPGSAGVLEKQIPLSARGASRRKETVRLKARVTPLPPPPGAACTVRLDLEARSGNASTAGRGGSASPETDSATLTLRPGEERLVEAYASTLMEARVALRVRCQPAVARASEEDGTRLVTLNVTIDRTAEGESTELLRQQVLTAAMAHSASTAASSNHALPDGSDGDKRYRSEDLEVTLSPILVVAGRLQIDVTVGGEVATRNASGESIRHPVEASGTFVVAPGEPRTLEFDVPSGGPEEGWGRVRFRVQVSSQF
jgi:hypothetical protein